MTSVTIPRTQDNLPTIDGIAADLELLRTRLKGGDKLTSRELRALWSERFRPFWRLNVELYRALSRRFLDLGDNYLASEVADEGAEFFGDDVALILTRALATSRSGAPQAAQELLARKEAMLADATEAKSLLARTFKDLWKSSGEERCLRESFDLYHLDYITTKGDRTFPGVNAASMALFLGRTAEARQIAGDVLILLRAKPDATGYWDRATVAECLLVAGQIEPARAEYSAATAGGKIAPASLATTRAQARLLLRQLGHAPAEFDSCFPLPGVLAFTGHRTDAAGRTVPRFPDALAPSIKERIRQAITESRAGFGYSAAASGADILFLEAMQEAGLETYVHLPLPEEEFIRVSVEQGTAAGWLERYREVTARATDFTTAPSAGGLAWDYGNRLLFGAARQHARQLGSEVRLLAVWDGRLGDGAGGTADYVRMVGEIGEPVTVIELPAGGAVSSAPLPPVPDEGEQLLTVLAFTVVAEGDAGQRAAALLQPEDLVHREVAGDRVRLFFRTSAAAAQAALALVAHLPGALGLHTGPVRLGTHPLTGHPVMLGDHTAKADELAALEPGGLIYASSAFAALLGLSGWSGARCEFLGYRRLRQRAAREPVFRLAP